MSLIRLGGRVVVVCLLGWSAARGAGDANSWPASFYEGHYRLTVGDDPAGAMALFERVQADGGLTAGQREELRGLMDDCRDRLASRNLARLFPAESIAYVEVHQPGALLERLTAMLGIPTEPILPRLARASADAKTGVSEQTGRRFGPHVPDRLAVSPALMAWVKSFRGAAAALTSLEHQGRHDVGGNGLLVIDLGETELVRGLMETAAQFGQPAAPVGGHAAIALPEGFCAVMTGRLVIAGRPRADVEAAVGRLQGDAKGSLAESQQFKVLTQGKAGSTVFGYVDAQKVLSFVRPLFEKDDEFQMGRSLCDLDHLAGAAFGVGAIDGGVGLDASILMEEGHHNLVYNLIRTPAMSRKSLACVPGNAAFVLGFGLNPPHGAEPEGTKAKGKMLTRVTGLDMFREIFGNIEEVSLYAAPSEGGLFGGQDETAARVPNGAVVIAAADAEKSEALWKQLLSLPSIIMHNEIAAPKEVEVSGQQATEFALPEIGHIYVARTGGCVVVAGRKESLAAVIRTARNGRSVLKDKAMRPAFEKLGKDVGLMAVLHCGRMLRTAGGMAPAMMGENGPPPAIMNMMTGTVTPAMETTLLYAGVVESDTEMGIRVCAAGLPNVNTLLTQFGPLMQMFQERSGRREHEDAEAAPRVRHGRRGEARGEARE